MITKSRNKRSDIGAVTPRSFPSVIIKTPSAALSAGWNNLFGLSELREYGEQQATKFAVYPLPSMADGEEIISYTRFKPPKYNLCTHRFTQLLNYAYTATYYTTALHTSVAGAYYMRRKDGYSTPTLSLVSTLNQHYTADADSARRTAWSTMQPRFEGDISMFNFIVELKDFKSLATKLLTKHPIAKLSNYMRKISRKIRKRGTWIADHSKPLAELHLQNEFALKPLLSDIFTITCQIEELVANVQQEFSDAGRERNSRHYTEELFRTEADIRTPANIANAPQITVGTTCTTTFNATMEYSYEYNMRGTLDAFMKYWGVYPSAEAVWNALPGSFLFDYFIKVGDSLKLASRDPNVLLNMSQYCESLKSVMSVGVCFKPEWLYAPVVLTGLTYGSMPVGLSTSNNQVHGARTLLYTRYPTSPNKGIALPRVKLPSSKQAINMLALARCFF